MATITEQNQLLRARVGAANMVNAARKDNDFKE
jgi:hypothetical protein